MLGRGLRRVRAAGGVTGSVVVSGSSTVEPITSLVGEDFTANNPDVDFVVDGPGTGDGFALFCNGETDISDASRPISEEETALCEEAGIPWVELKVAVDGISVLTSPSNEAVTASRSVTSTRSSARSRRASTTGAPRTSWQPNSTEATSAPPTPRSRMRRSR